jgi:hypothetical protein
MSVNEKQIDELFTNYNGYLMRFCIISKQEKNNLTFQKYSYDLQENEFKCIAEAAIRVEDFEVLSFGKAKHDKYRIDIWLLVSTRDGNSFWQVVSIFPDNQNPSFDFKCYKSCLKMKIQEENCLIEIEEKNIFYSVYLLAENDNLMFQIFNESQNEEFSIKIPSRIEKINNYEIIFVFNFHTENLYLIILKIGSIKSDSLLAVLYRLVNENFIIEEINTEYLLGELDNFNYEFESYHSSFKLKNIFCFNLSLKTNEISVRADGNVLFNMFSNVQNKSRVLYCSNGYICNEIVSNYEYTMIYTISLDFLNVSGDEYLSDELFIVAKLKENDKSSSSSFHFFKENDSEFSKIVYSILNVDQILSDEFILNCDCCLSNQLLIIKDWCKNEFILEHKIKTNNNLTQESNEKIVGDISYNFISNLKNPIFQQIKRLLEFKIDEGNSVLNNILREIKYKYYLIENLKNIQFQQNHELLYLTKLYSRNKMKMINIQPNPIMNSCKIIKKWACFFDQNLTVNFIIKKPNNK